GAVDGGEAMVAFSACLTSAATPAEAAERPDRVWNSKRVTENFGNVRVKRAPRPLILVVTGTSLTGSWIESVSCGLSAASTTASPLRATEATPVMMTLTGCGASAT